MNFKKHISLFLAFFLLVSNVGFALDVHYCGVEIASIKPVFGKILNLKIRLKKVVVMQNLSIFLKKTAAVARIKS